jgi:hypothetical protein
MTTPTTEPAGRYLSLGAGRQSSAIAMMSARGEFPKLDAAIFSDTGAEPQAVYDHLGRLEREVLEPAGIPLYRVSYGNLGDDLLDPDRLAMIPAYTLSPDGQQGMLGRKCTQRYKLSPILAQVRLLLGATTSKTPCRYCEATGERVAPWRARRGENTIGICSVCRGTGEIERVGQPPTGVWAEQWIGFSADEIGRVSNKGDTRYSRSRYPLIEQNMTTEQCIAYMRHHGFTSVAKSACVFCLAYETEVITSEGAKPIGSLVNDSGVGKATLLIPRPRSGWASWREVEVRSFGTQRLWKVSLGKGRSKKTVYATAEHRWKTRARNGCWSDFVTTADLRIGDVLPTSRAQTPWAGRNKALPSPFGIAAGFTFGDGTRSADGNRAASADFHGEKQELLKYFSNCTVSSEVSPSGGVTFKRVWGLPRFWKDTPALTEARGYLLGWLAGYFAADGTVSEKGQATLFSARRDHITYVRDLCYVLGVRTSPLLEKTHPAIGGPATIYSVTFNVRDLPESFWLLPHHAERIATKMATTQPRDTGWTVTSIEPTDRIEEVFCAVVPEDEMFVLADNVVTGNCPYRGNREWRQLRDTAPEDWRRAVEFDEAYRHGAGMNSDRFLHISCKPLAEAPIDRVRPSENQQIDLFDAAFEQRLEEGDPDGCSPWACRSGEPVTVPVEDVA